MRRYRLSRKAEEDIIATYMYGVAEFGVQQAQHYHDLLERKFRFLAENPEAAVRIHPIESRIVIYTVDDSGDIFTVRVRHGREGWRRAE
ncbi:type II toxin-antitoxin system RelE/ParE family toxin [Steroidobacter sp.]|uniref:type II toxin-antitoxin system RelE/ParE family toxin n=1 Tax=Steroidobacter sp. TaxID=1978227 RepID=UPI001A4A49F5|nr:type II toxin-antitoxin system RelE/ParE family toxin [Steroidobacter sp.]MBL8270116.1 type II toxin-antitoxin system RelE/ParE family toxin [Steroidobacter sp.]